MCTVYTSSATTSGISLASGNEIIFIIQNPQNYFYIRHTNLNRLWKVAIYQNSHKNFITHFVNIHTHTHKCICIHLVGSEIYPWTSFNFHLISFSFSCVLYYIYICVFLVLSLAYKFSLTKRNVIEIFSFWFEDYKIVIHLYMWAVMAICRIC